MSKNIPNFTLFPSWLLENDVMKSLNVDWRVICYLVRITYGYNETVSTMTESWIGAPIGVTDAQVTRALDALELKGYVKRKYGSVEWITEEDYEELSQRFAEEPEKKKRITNKQWLEEFDRKHRSLTPEEKYESAMSDFSPKVRQKIIEVIAEVKRTNSRCVTLAKVNDFLKSISRDYPEQCLIDGLERYLSSGKYQTEPLRYCFGIIRNKYKENGVQKQEDDKVIEINYKPGVRFNTSELNPYKSLETDERYVSMKAAIEAGLADEKVFEWVKQKERLMKSISDFDDFKDYKEAQEFYKGRLKKSFESPDNWSNKMVKDLVGKEKARRLKNEELTAKVGFPAEYTEGADD